MKRGAVAVVALAALACAPDASRRAPELPLAVPRAWQAGDDAAGAWPGEAWWRSFADAGLSAAIEESLEHNYDLRQAEARLSAAAAEARIAGADRFPTVELNVNGSRRKQNFIGFPIPGSSGGVLSTTTSTYGVSLDTSWEADLWGRLRADSAAAVEQLLASRADLTGARLSIAGQTAKAWFALSEARRQVELSEQTVEAFRQTTERVRSRYEAGLRSSLDLRLALSDQAAAEAVLEQRRDRLQRTRRQLEVLMGRYPSGSAAGSRDLPPPPAPIPTGLPAELVARRPDLAASEHRLLAADSRLAAARRSLYPRLRLTASGGTTTPELGDLLDGDFSVWSLAAGLLQPVFQGGRLRAGVDRAEADRQRLLASYVQNALTAFAEVESALNAESILARQEHALVVATEQALAARDLAEDRYVSGLVDIITVLTSQRRALTAESALLAVRRQRLDNRVDLILSLGGGFESGPASFSPGETGATEASAS